MELRDQEAKRLFRNLHEEQRKLGLRFCPALTGEGCPGAGPRATSGEVGCGDIAGDWMHELRIRPSPIFLYVWFMEGSL